MKVQWLTWYGLIQTLIRRILQFLPGRFSLVPCGIANNVTIFLVVRDTRSAPVLCESS